MQERVRVAAERRGLGHRLAGAGLVVGVLEVHQERARPQGLRQRVQAHPALGIDGDLHVFAAGGVGRPQHRRMLDGRRQDALRAGAVRGGGTAHGQVHRFGSPRREREPIG